MRKVKKFMALGAAAVMAASMLAGCGGSGSAATEAQTFLCLRRGVSLCARVCFRG